MTQQGPGDAVLGIPPGETQQLPGPRRLNGTMQRYLELAVSVARPVALAVVAILLILVVLPAALGAQAGAIR